ncbi:MAG: TonB-dependent receptor domain-containing protein [Vicinamibacterales bacterium]
MLIASPLVAQTAGRIQGTVTDNTGAPVPGVAVHATSPSLQGVQSAVTDAKGEFRFASVPPGTYAVKSELSGFKTFNQTGVVVGLDRTVTLTFKMEVAAVAETVTVTGESPIIDTASTTTGVNVTADLFTRIPVQRDIYSISRVAAGSQNDGVGASFYGSTGAENNYIIDGLNTTGIEVGAEAKQLNFDFVEEIEVKTGGLPAEYGRMTGGILNVLTKSGGNTFKGDLFGFYEGSGLQSDDSTAADRPATTTQVTDIDNRWDFGGDLGGYLLKDKLWFFGAYNRTNRTDDVTVIRALAAPGSPSIGSQIPRETKRDLFAGKLTWSPSPNHTLTASAFGDPGTITGPVFIIAGPEVTWNGTRDIGSTDIVGRYDGTFGNSFLIRAMYGLHREKDIYGGAGRNTAQLIDQTVSPNTTQNGFTFFQDQEFSRDVLKLDMTKFLGRHEIKLGGDYELVNSLSENYQGGAGQRIYQIRQASTGIVYYRHRYYVDDLAPGFNRDDPSTWQIALPQVAEPRTKGFSAYLQDSWKVTPYFTLNLGLRWEMQDVQNRFSESAFKLDDNWAPRLGFIWDISKSGKSKLYANYGRFYENIPQDINIRSFGGEAVCFCYNFSANPADIASVAGTPSRSSLLGGATPVDPELKGQYMDEYLGGFEYEVAPNFVLGTKVTYRDLGRVIEDFLVIDEGGYFIANPAEGTLGQTLTFYDYSTAPAVPAKRENWSVELTARKRFSNNWQLLASYVWNKLEGNYDGLFQNSTGQLDPNINSAFDYADFLINSQGPLSAERKHQFKLDGSYQFRGALDGMNLGLSTWYYSGLPLNAYGYSFGYANWEYFVVPRGSVGRGPSDWEANLHLSYPIKIGDRSRLTVMADVFNVFNRQAVAQYDERYNLPSDGDACAGIPAGICGSGGGIANIPNTLDPAGVVPNPRATATNPDYLSKGVAFTEPRSIRLGIRWTF